MTLLHYTGRRAPRASPERLDYPRPSSEPYTILVAGWTGHNLWRYVFACSKDELLELCMAFNFGVPDENEITIIGVCIPSYDDMPNERKLAIVRWCHARCPQFQSAPTPANLGE